MAVKSPEVEPEKRHAWIIPFHGLVAKASLNRPRNVLIRSQISTPLHPSHHLLAASSSSSLSSINPSSRLIKNVSIALSQRSRAVDNSLPTQPPNIIPPTPSPPPGINPPQLLPFLKVQPFLLLVLRADDVRPPPPDKRRPEQGGRGLQPRSYRGRVGGYAVEAGREGDGDVAVAGAVAGVERDGEVGEEEVED